MQALQRSADVVYRQTDLYAVTDNKGRLQLAASRANKIKTATGEKMSLISHVKHSLTTSIKATQHLQQKCRKAITAKRLCAYRIEKLQNVFIILLSDYLLAYESEINKYNSKTTLKYIINSLVDKYNPQTKKYYCT